MKKKSILFFFLLIVIILGLGGIIYYFYNEENSSFFNPGNRYDWSQLNYMDVIYENQSDIQAWNEGYSESDQCPWGFKHLGLDYFFKNGSNVIAAAPGQVQEIVDHDSTSQFNKYHVAIWIRFNETIRLGYNFEPWSTNESDREKQRQMFKIEVGDWVSQGQVIAQFLECNISAHIHFDLVENQEWYCPRKYFSTAGYNEIMNLIEFYHPGENWQLCYS